MNRIEKRIAGTRPGAPVCNPGKPTNNIGMLGGTSYLHQQANKQANKQINGVAMLQNQGHRLKRLENKLEQMEKQQAIDSTNIDLINDKTTTKIELMQNYITALEFKITELESNNQVTAVKNNTITQENITLEIIEN
tara:strand:- start:3362 stop:3772 length:411 start_codon:yes stop_codon:yes gene_type:complete